MKFPVLKAFAIGLATFSASEAIYYFLESSGHATEGARLLINFLGIFFGALSIAIFAPRFKFSMAVLLSVPASVLMGACSAFAIATGVIPASEHQRENSSIFISLMNFPFVLYISALGSILGCIVSFSRAKSARVT